MNSSKLPKLSSEIIIEEANRAILLRKKMQYLLTTLQSTGFK